MKTFEFTKKLNKQIVKAMIRGGYVTDDEVMALTSIERHIYNDKVHIYKSYKGEQKTTYAYYEKDKTILRFANEIEAYKFVLTI